MSAALSAGAFLARLRDEGARRYHDRHPFHLAMHAGQLSRAQLQAWVANRYYYQTRIPIKDALIVSKSEDPRFRRMWLHRIVDHDGAAEGQGGLALWRRLGRAVGLDDDELIALGRVLPGVRVACDRYVELVRGATLPEAVAASLTECFAPALMQTRLAAWRAHYPWVGEEALAYFCGRVARAAGDAEEALRFVVEHAASRDEQERCVAALIAKTEILWELCDCLAAAYPLEGDGVARAAASDR